MDEFALIRLLNRKEVRNPDVEVGIGDDAAVVRVSPGRRLVLSCDTMVEDIHFKTVTMRDSDIGHKAMASNLSDMAAMGAVPKFALVALSVPRTHPVSRLQRLYEGLYDCAAQYGVAVVGGDTTSSPAGLTVTVSIVGEVEAGRALLRSAARPGDRVFVTGPLGGAAAGLDYLLRRNEPADTLRDIPPHVEPLVRAHQLPQPQTEAGRLLAESGHCHALNDISDGLASEAWEIAEASGVGLLLEEARIPLASGLERYAAETGRDAMDWVLFGGEDYQLIGTLPERHVRAVEERFRAAGLPFHVIGEVTEGDPGVRFVHRSGEIRPIPKRGYNHFA